jgi:hypothetical protein
LKYAQSAYPRKGQSPLEAPRVLGPKVLNPPAGASTQALAKHLGMPAPDINEDETIYRADAVALLNQVFGHMFPGLHAS